MEPPRKMSKLGKNCGAKSSEEGPLALALPAQIWARILTYCCDIQDIRQCLMVNKFFWNEVPAHITSLDIYKAAELDLCFAAKVPRVTTVRIFSLVGISWMPPETYSCHPPSFFCEASARKMVPFLKAFPELEAVHIGGHVVVLLGDETAAAVALLLTHRRIPAPFHDKKTIFLRDEEPEDELWVDMINSFCDSFQDGSLDSSRLQITGPMIHQVERMHGTQMPCQFCLRFCETFPLPCVYKASPFNCVSERPRCDIIFQRDNTFLMDSSLMLDLLCGFGLTTFDGFGFAMMLTFSDEELGKIEHAKTNWNCDASNVPSDGMEASLRSRAEEIEAMGMLVYCRDGGKRRPFIARAIFDALKAAGYRLRSADFKIIIPVGDRWRGDIDREEEEEVESGGEDETTDEAKAASKKIDYLLGRAARLHDESYRTGAKFNFSPTDSSLRSAKKKYGSPRLLAMLLTFQCTGDGHDLSESEENSGIRGRCPRLGTEFVPNGNGFGDVQPECARCYEEHACDDGLYPEHCWSAKSAQMYFNMNGLEETLRTGGPPHSRVSHSTLDPSPFSRGEGGVPVFAANQVTWGVQLLQSNIWLLYLALIQKDDSER